MPFVSSHPPPHPLKTLRGHLPSFQSPCPNFSKNRTPQLFPVSKSNSKSPI
jgi:hypothetical protein